MPCRYDIHASDCSPDAVVIREDWVFEYYKRLKESRRHNTWETDLGVPVSLRTRIRRSMRLMLGRPFRPCENVGGLLLKADQHEPPLEPRDGWTAAQLLLELSVCAVPRYSRNTTCREHRHMFFNDTEHWRDFFPQLHAIWSQDDRVAVFYGWGHERSFTKWATVFHPDLAEALQYYRNTIIVVVPSIRLINPTLLCALESERDRIWGPTASGY